MPVPIGTQRVKPLTCKSMYHSEHTCRCIIHNICFGSIFFLGLKIFKPV